MDKLITFITILAWIIGVWSTLLIILRVIALSLYTDMERLADRMDGKIYKFPLARPALVAIVSWTWIFTF